MSATAKLSLGRAVFVSRGPGFDTPGMKLDGGTILWYSDMRPDS